MPGAGSTKRAHAVAIKAAKMAALAYTHRDIAIAIGKNPDQIKGLILLGKRLLAATNSTTEGK